ncbi:TIGR01457 family HAD-type hydrolase [Bacillus kwashiorkori]|uniref:TIGR01457 family HAD-type hydrolase n=1 Tax=Bacillus kwashiorkori TaxID=1522318 RepID=UPI000781E7DB|nr:TIGR01457 family HAD-type hydrolase [Bacillus kwashiorkori]
MKQYKGYLIDLDGTMYRGTEKIAAASDFVKSLVEANIPYLFLTNNSTRTPEQVASKLNEFDIPANSEQVFTSSLATANYIYNLQKGAKIYCIGEEGLFAALEEYGFQMAKEDADYVVVGLDREVTYEKFAIACLAIRNGAKFISTNGDIALPTERGFMPGSGSLAALVSCSTATKPVTIGKPENIITDLALKVLGTKKEETLMVGDNYDTDILAGMNAGIDTLLVLTGVTTVEQLQKIDKQPTHIIQSLDEWKVK